MTENINPFQERHPSWPARDGTHWDVVATVFALILELSRKFCRGAVTRHYGSVQDESFRA